MKTYLLHHPQLLSSSSSLSARLKPEKARHRDIVNKPSYAHVIIEFIKDTEQKPSGHIRYILPYSIRDVTKETCRKRRDIYYCIWNIKTQNISQQRVQAVKDAAFLNQVNLWRLYIHLCLMQNVPSFSWSQDDLFRCPASGHVLQEHHSHSNGFLSKLRQPWWPERLSQVASTLYSSLQERDSKK